MRNQFVIFVLSESLSDSATASSRLEFRVAEVVRLLIEDRKTELSQVWLPRFLSLKTHSQKSFQRTLNGCRQSLSLGESAIAEHDNSTA